MNIKILLNANRYLRPGNPFAFSLAVNQIVLNGIHMNYVKNLRIGLKREQAYRITVNSSIPCNISSRLPLPLPSSKGSWYPQMLIEGTDEFGYIQEIPLFYTRPIISTTYHPIYDARLARSNWTLDEKKIMRIKSILNSCGFDCTTIGKEIQPLIPKGKGFMDFEKEWASGGDCFISILTPRDRTNNGNLALPPPWVVTESGLSYESNRPHLVFVEKGVKRAALYGEMDNMHIIGFSTDQGTLRIEKNFSSKIMRFRNECYTNQSNKTLQGVGQFIFAGLAIYGGYKILEGFFDK